MDLNDFKEVLKILTLKMNIPYQILAEEKRRLLNWCFKFCAAYAIEKIVGIVVVFGAIGDRTAKYDTATSTSGYPHWTLGYLW